VATPQGATFSKVYLFSECTTRSRQNVYDSIQCVESSVDFGIVRMKEVLERLPDALNILNTGKIVEHFCCSTYYFASCERGALFHLQVGLDSV
jgi:hypothetical protein